MADQDAGAVLVQQGLADALDPATDGVKGEEADPKVRAKKEEMAVKAHSAIVLSLGDRVLREVSKESTAVGIWAKLESIYMTKSLANRLYMKQKLYSYKFQEGKGISEQLEEFNKSVDDLENIDVKIDDEDKAIVHLNALPKSFDQLKDAMRCSMEETQRSLLRRCKRHLKPRSSKEITSSSKMHLQKA